MPTATPRVAPPMAKPKVNSWAVNGGIRESMMLPWIFEIMIDDEVLAKAFWAMAMTISPGARNSMNATPATTRVLPPSASEKMAKNSSVVTTGATRVWV